VLGWKECTRHDAATPCGRWPRTMARACGRAWWNGTDRAPRDVLLGAMTEAGMGAPDGAAETRSGSSALRASRQLRELKKARS